jgi:cation diffusion facilitator CzcD-associated flavoprotein CzcO
MAIMGTGAAQLVVLLLAFRPHRVDDLAVATAVSARHDYCIVGAGPGGLQLGHLMLLAGRDYIIYERSRTPGSFFERFPIHRKLISLNKRHTGRANPEFNLRHDWNSLLGNPACPSVPSRTTERFPHADVLVAYLRDFAQPQQQAGRIAYGTQVQLIRRDPGGDGFTLDLRTQESQLTAECAVLIIAAGLSTPNIPTLEGAELLTGYETLPSTGYHMEGKSVAVLGMGNSAFVGLFHYVNTASWSTSPH